ncbi:Ltp family lipoprotein [Nocardia nova]
MTEQFHAQQPGLPSSAPTSTRRKTRPRVAGAIVLLSTLATAFGGGNIEKASAAAPTDNATATVAVAFSPAKQQPSSGQRNAAQSAKQYLEMTGFSRSGLIHQLEYEGYSTADATSAVDSLNADWNQQAVRCAKQYLEMTSFSRSGLVDQLVYDGFTHEQAEYGANAAY